MRVRYLIKQFNTDWKEVDKDVWEAHQDSALHDASKYNIEIVNYEDDVKARSGREFRPAFDMPTNLGEAIDVLFMWSQSMCHTFSHRRAKRIYDIIEYARGTWIDQECKKDGDIACIVNELRDVAVKYGPYHQLRERIVDVIVPHLKELADLRHRMEGLEK